MIPVLKLDEFPSFLFTSLSPKILYLMFSSYLCHEIVKFVIFSQASDVIDLNLHEFEFFFSQDLNFLIR